MVAPYALVICGDAGNIIIEHNADADVTNWISRRIEHGDMDGVFKKVTTGKHREFSAAVAWEWAAERETELRADPARSEDELTSLCELLSELNSADEQDTTVMIGEFCDEFGHEWPDLSYYNQSAFFLYECLSWFCQQMNAVTTAPQLCEFEVTQYQTFAHKMIIKGETATDAVIQSWEYTDTNPEFVEINEDIGVSLEEFPTLAESLEEAGHYNETHIPGLANIKQIVRDDKGNITHYLHVETGEPIEDKDSEDAALHKNENH